MSKIIIDSLTFDGKHGWRTIKKVLKLGEKLDVQVIEWNNCTFSNMKIDYKKLHNDSQRNFIKWLAKR